MRSLGRWANRLLCNNVLPASPFPVRQGYYTTKFRIMSNFFAPTDKIRIRPCLPPPQRAAGYFLKFLKKV